MRVKTPPSKYQANIQFASHQISSMHMNGVARWFADIQLLQKGFKAFLDVWHQFSSRRAMQILRKQKGTCQEGPRYFKKMKRAFKCVGDHLSQQEETTEQ